MPRNTEAELLAIVEVPSSASLATFLDTASLLVVENLESAGMTEARLKLIELYLAAHFVTLTYEGGGLVGKKIGDTTEWYQKVSLDAQGFRSSRFGQQALALDSSGVLTGLTTAKPRARFTVV
jgi:hypothetical protein